MKITPSNQTLILAGERRGSGAAPVGASAKPISSTGAVLQRVTIVAAQPDSTVVYLRADYATPGSRRDFNPTTDSPDAEFLDSSAASPAPRAGSASSALVVRPQNANPSRDGYGNALSSRPVAAISSHLPPVEQYAQTQRLGGSTAAVSRIDVHA